MSVVQACINQAAYNAFYDLAACALETHNPERAVQRVIEARDYLPQADVNRLVRELEADYYEFT
ncbi:hypothetical protein WM27_21095 [Burkholderia ubonensis]|uniref:hypothetical protein n=1 Tax=Burkholderia ubonensis TaxID=101571 RepID=UPI00075FA9E7|nr:hypothetical protein [Burkholderia ubonensis]KWO18384.1 hypothetical protein WM27_21095 [Burkholderia ubonensis]ODQ31086.1 hypothetical protein BGV65_18815 [Burkholderia ubonensis]